MEIIKPLRLGVLHRPYYVRQQPQLGITVIALVALGHVQPVLLPEQELWELLEEELSDEGLLDLMMPKPAAEYLVSGIATTLHQTDKTRCAIEASVGDKQKRLTVFGDRDWRAGIASAPQPFERIPIDRSHAYGGPAYAENQIGIGHAPEWIDGQQWHRLPNVEHAYPLLSAPSQQIEPAGLGMVDIGAPSHMALLGRYDDQWLQQHAPGFPPSFDWHYFNVAPLDQQWRGQDRLPAGLNYRFVNMHPELPVFAGRLPMAQARCFITRQDDEPAALDGHEELESLLFDEVPLRLTTAWFVPHEECAILIYHGTLAVDDEQASNVLHLMPAFESLDAPQPLAHYESVFAQRVDADDGDLYVFDEAALISPSLIGPGFDTEPLAAQVAGSLEQRLDARILATRHDADQRMRAAGMAPLTEESPDLPQLQRLADLPQFDAALRRKADEAASRANAERQSLIDELRLRPADATAQTLLAQLESADRSPPFDFAAREAQLRSMQLPAGFVASGSMTPPLPPAEERIRQLRQLYLHSAPFCAAAPALSAEASSAVREQVLARYAADRDLRGLDLTGADLSGLDLSGARLAGALLESTNLEGCTLDEADLSGAVLVRARLSGCSLISANLACANLSHVVAREACFADAVIGASDWQEAEFIDCDFREVSISALSLQQSEFRHCQFAEAALEDVDFHLCTLEQVHFDHAVLAGCTWLGCKLEQVLFDDAVLDGCSLTETDAIEISFAGARLDDCYAALDCDLSAADFSDARLKDCNLRDTRLVQAYMAGATLATCDLSGASLQGADLSRVQAGGSLFIGTRLVGARLPEANLMQALLRAADLRGADLRGAHLFESDLALVQLDASTILDQVHAERVNLYPRAPAETTP